MRIYRSHFGFEVISLRLLKSLVVAGWLAVAIGCSTLAQRNSSGVIVANRAQIRSSNAVVAADLLEVKRGDLVDVLESVDVPDPTDNTKKERWLRVRAHDEESTEGWIESRNVMPEEVLEASRKVAEEDKDIPAQATGQLRSSSNFRLTPDRGESENIMMRLDSGSSFEIVGWKRVPKPTTSDSIESDVAPKAGTAERTQSRGRSGPEESEVEENNELWYKVRLPASISPAPGGWIYGKQVQLTVPSDIIFYRTGREFVAWQRLDGSASENDSPATEKNAGRESRPGSWVILEKSNTNQPHTIDEPDFDRVYVVGYDKRNQEHYTAYRGPDVKGYLPMRIEGRGENKTFKVRIQESSGQVTEVSYGVYKDARGVLKIAAPNSVAK